MVDRDTVDYRDTSSFDDSSLQDVQTIKSAILHKQYGKDVRSALSQLPDSLIKLFGDTGGNSNAEVEEARGEFETLGLHEQAQNAGIDKVTAEVQNARTNSSSQIFPTLKERIDNQESKIDNRIDNKLAQISSVPETFANLAALKNTYPNGRTGIFVTADTGHKYIWANNMWNDAGVYQSVGIADSSVKNNMLANNTSIGIVFPSGDNPLNFNTAAHTLTIQTSINIVVRGSNQYSVPAQTLSLKNAVGNNHYIVYDTITGNLGLFDGATIDDTKVIIGGVRDLIFYINGPYTVDGFYPYGNDRQAYYSIYSNGSGITVDTTNKTINLNGLFFNYGSLNIPLTNKSITYNTDGPLFVYYNAVSKEIQMEMPPINTTSDRVFLGWIRPLNATYSLNVSEKQIKFTPVLPDNEYLSTLPNIIGLGDSITAGYVPNASLNGGWPTILSQNVGITVYNEGVSSATIQNGSANDSISFVNRSATIDFSRANDVVIFGGTNDFAQNLPIGNISDNTPNSLYGAMNIIFSKIYASNPNAKVYIVLPMWRARITGGNVDVETTPNSIGLLLKDYCEALKNVANKYNVPYLDAYHNMGINSINSTNWLSDGLHPNDIGYAHLANLIGNFVKTKQ
ncbi:SGNH/GDSL hydrolase family protein [Leuconostoc falkenbergense]|uniref:SGNH/GDSL hydrolase family protein n=1 Tax=Leuconostoc falkenbergense TaxID=2766470 RepID=A0ABT7RZ78_9LACO|nr:SGNH/GDSL hydrolase family protein [Leuconostoc falkenbergense]MDM7646607.1 SGNH/GDSL hydrolase family protein [Leuconostoc falkenbergense]